MKNYRFIVIYGLITVSYLLSFILPVLVDKQYRLNDNGEVFELSSDNKNIFSFDGSETTIIIIALATFFSLLSLIRLNQNQNPGYFSIISVFLAFYGYIKIDQFRADMISAGYRGSVSFKNVAPYGIGLWIYLFGLTLNIFAAYYNRYYQTGEIREIFQAGFVKNAKKFYGPTFIQYTVIHSLSLIFMILTYGQYAGWEKAIKGPAYYQNAILTFGLNFDSSPMFGKDDILVSFFLAPILIFTIGLSLFYLPATGFAPNGPGVQETAVESKFYVGSGFDFNIWGYFSQPLPGANDFLFDNPKWTYFYLLLIFVPIILGSIIGALINQRLFDRSLPKFFSYIRFYAFITWISAWLLADAAAPVYVQPSGIFKSLFDDELKNTNLFIRYRYLQIDLADVGNYHPLAVFWYAILLLIIVSVFSIIMASVINSITSGEFRQQKESTEIKGKYYDEKLSELPFGKVEH